MRTGRVRTRRVRTGRVPGRSAWSWSAAVWQLPVLWAAWPWYDHERAVWVRVVVFVSVVLATVVIAVVPAKTAWWHGFHRNYVWVVCSAVCAATLWGALHLAHGAVGDHRLMRGPTATVTATLTQCRGGTFEGLPTCLYSWTVDGHRGRQRDVVASATHHPRQKQIRVNTDQNVELVHTRFREVAKWTVAGLLLAIDLAVFTAGRSAFERNLADGQRRRRPW